MTKTQEELNQLNECEASNTKFKQLSEDEMTYVVGGDKPNANIYFVAEELDISSVSDNKE